MRLDDAAATTPARSDRAAAARAVAVALRAELGAVDYDRLTGWDVVELIGRTVEVLDGLIAADTAHDELWFHYRDMLKTVVGLTDQVVRLKGQSGGGC